ncbi:type II toxin-antitoxin system VapC family toxin [Pedobacter jejuensis]|uniref:Type II toxin-antitoxin system VapC family toxin n=1 Tax=Pedobacter jejuensis TaxID=1268550 RepID=A0A3N0BWK4_9SPHI|nr:type II toxin-antitoxin system VapC family toxin [Pedobacter jejuensis]RNL54089.1 type II toxin-antitoxin system VapC family toxin [Pedobacter jejuensis]
MSLFSFVADTNFLINVHEGLEKTEPFLDGTAIVSVISEIELLGWHLLNKKDKLSLEALLADCVIIELNSEIKNIAITLRQNYKIKTPDAIIAATAKFLQMPLVTSDKGFASVADIELILI